MLDCMLGLVIYCYDCVTLYIFPVMLNTLTLQIKYVKITLIFQKNEIRKKYVKIRLFTTGQDCYTVYKLSKRCKFQHTTVY